MRYGAPWAGSTSRFPEKAAWDVWKAIFARLPGARPAERDLTLRGYSWDDLAVCLSEEVGEAPFA